jgi:flagellar assembly factor FliW
MARAQQQVRVPGLGVLKVSQRRVFTFPSGLIGFEQLRKFVVASSAAMEPLKWLISLEQPEIALPTLVPWHVDPGYELPPEFQDPETFVPLAVVAFEPSGQILVNLKAPIVLNVRTLQGRQVVIPGDRYSATHPLSIAVPRAG